MKGFLVSSINPQGYTVTTRHVSPMSVATEKLRRSLAGHVTIVVQELPRIFPAEPLQKRQPPSPLLSKGGSGD